MPTNGDYVSYNSMQQQVGLPPPAIQQPFVPFLSAQPVPFQFQNPYQAQIQNAQQSSDRQFLGTIAAGGMGVRMGTNLGFGGIGAAIGSRFGARGAVIGAFTGFLGSELSGAGQFGQGMYANYISAPFLANRAATGSIEEMSQGFGAVGNPFLSPTGQGFSHHAAQQAATGIGNLANNQFNRADMFKITQLSSQTGLLGGTQSPQQMISKVKEISQSLTIFMQLANEPDIQNAIKTMGNLRSQGLNLPETLQAVSNGRSYARMAGATFDEILQVGGGMGANAFNQRGLSAGLGSQIGMQNYAAARAANLGSGIMNMMGGAQGLANANNQFSANMLQLPMMAPGMMSAAGGLSGGAINNLMSGNANLFNMTSRGSNVLTQMTGRQGIEGLGMAVAMQPLLQDSLGRLIQSQGPFAQRNMEDNQIMQLARQMGMRGSAGFLTAAQALGMSQTQAVARAGELADPAFFERQRQQIRVRAREEASSERQSIRDNAPGLFDELASNNTYLYGAGRAYNRLAIGVGHLFNHPDEMYQPETAWERRDIRRALREPIGSSRLPMNQRRAGEHFDALDVVQNRGGATGLSGALAGFGLAITSSRRELDTDLRGMEQDRRVAASLRNTTALDIRNQPNMFKNNSDAQAAFAQNVANLFNTPQTAMGGGIASTVANAALRGGAQALTGGLLDPGNITANRDVSTAQIREAYINSMTATGMSRQEAEQNFNNNQSSIMSSVAGQVRGRLSDVGRNALDSQATRNVMPSRTINLRQMEEQAYGALGSTTVDSRRQIDRLMGMFGEGFGRNDAQRRSSRNYMSAYAALRVQMQNSEQRAAAQRQMAQLEQQARAEGIDIERVRETVEERERTGALGGREMQEAAQNIRTENITAGMFGSVDQQRTRTRAIQQLSRGLQNLGQQEGALGDVFRGVMSERGELDMDLLQRRLRTTDYTKLRRADPRMAQLIQRFQQANDPRAQERILGEIQGAIGEVGAQGLQDEQESTQLGITGRFRETWNRGEGIFSSVMNAISPGRFIAGRSVAGTQAGQRAQQDLSAVDAAQANAEGMGMGTASDRLLDASRELSEAARNLNRTTSGNIIDSLFPGDRR